MLRNLVAQGVVSGNDSHPEENQVNKQHKVPSPCLSDARKQATNSNKTWSKKFTP